MNLILIIAVVVGIFIFLVALGFILKIFRKLLGLAFLILVVLAIISGYSIYRDVENFNNKFNESSNVFLLMDEKNLEAGFTKDRDEVMFLDEDLIEKYQRYINRKKYDEILDDNYKVWFIDILAFEDEENFDKLVEEKDFLEKSLLFSRMVSEKLEDDVMFFFRQYKKDNIEVHPKTALFRFIDVIPVAFLKKIAEKAQVKAEQKIENFIKNRTEEMV